MARHILVTGAARYLGFNLIPGLHRRGFHVTALDTFTRAGGGGFLLIVMPPHARSRFETAMNGACLIPVGMDRQSSIILTG